MGSLLLSSTLLALKFNAKSVAGIGLCITLLICTVCVYHHLVVVSIVWSVYLHVSLE